MQFDQLKRRQFITLLGGVAVAWPLAARAQPPAMPLVGFVSPVLRDLFAAAFRPFLQGLSEAGYVEGRNAAIDYRSTEGRNDLLPAVLADLLGRQVTVLVAAGNSQVVAAKAATTTIPIVFLTGDDPVKLGFVASLNKPGGNLTGVTTLGLAVGPKRLELLRELLPVATSIALLVNPTNPISTENQTRDLQTAARTLGLQLHVLHASSERDFETVFADLTRLRVEALVILPDGFLISRSKQLAALALRQSVPAIFQNRGFAVAGGLMSYGSSTEDAWRLVGIYTGRILKGEKPADLPVQQSAKIELFINLKTAKALGITFPLTLLGRADEVIE
jgi:putative tryptophan/tyrosine transport system substrate-binding protein